MSIVTLAMGLSSILSSTLCQVRNQCAIQMDCYLMKGLSTEVYPSTKIKLFENHLTCYRINLKFKVSLTLINLELKIINYCLNIALSSFVIISNPILLINSWLHLKITDCSITLCLLMISIC